jgi:hypothetical protein
MSGGFQDRWDRALLRPSGLAERSRPTERLLRGVLLMKLIFFTELPAEFESPRGLPFGAKSVDVAEPVLSIPADTLGRAVLNVGDTLPWGSVVASRSF